MSRKGPGDGWPLLALILCLLGGVLLHQTGAPRSRGALVSPCLVCFSVLQYHQYPKALGTRALRWKARAASSGIALAPRYPPGPSALVKRASALLRPHHVLHSVCLCSCTLLPHLSGARPNPSLAFKALLKSSFLYKVYSNHSFTEL